MSYETMSKVIWIFIGIVFVLLLAYWITMGVLGYLALDTLLGEDFSSGLKPVLEKLWCGSPGCL